jgi:hypothetical protein
MKNLQFQFNVFKNETNTKQDGKFPKRLRCDLILWLLFDQAKSSIRRQHVKNKQPCSISNGLTQCSSPLQTLGRIAMRPSAELAEFCE